MTDAVEAAREEFLRRLGDGMGTVGAAAFLDEVIAIVRADERAKVAEAVKPSVRWGAFATPVERYAYQCGVIDGKHIGGAKVQPESALRAAARAVVEWHESLYGPCEAGCECSITAIKAALDGAPYEPSEAEAERLGEWLAKHDDEEISWRLGMEDRTSASYEVVVKDYLELARAALKAAWGEVPR